MGGEGGGKKRNEGKVYVLIHYLPPRPCRFAQYKSLIQLKQVREENVVEVKGRKRRRERERKQHHHQQQQHITHHSQTPSRICVWEKIKRFCCLVLNRYFSISFRNRSEIWDCFLRTANVSMCLVPQLRWNFANRPVARRLRRNFRSRVLWVKFRVYCEEIQISTLKF